MREPVGDPLVTVALDLFGRRGVEGVGTREIATAAGKPMSAITYRHGGKKGLYLACARHIADEFNRRLSRLDLATPCQDPDEAFENLALLLRTMTRVMLSEETESFARFIAREQQEPTEAFGIIYDSAMGPVLIRIVELLTVLGKGRLTRSQARVRAMSLVGQILAFRLARAAALRLNQWEDLGPEMREAIEEGLAANLQAIVGDLGGRNA